MVFGTLYFSSQFSLLHLHKSAWQKLTKHPVYTQILKNLGDSKVDRFWFSDNTNKSIALF